MSVMVAAGHVSGGTPPAHGAYGERDMIMGKLIADIEDWTDYDQGLLGADGIEERIGELKDIRDEAESEGEGLTVDEAAELKMWQTFRAAVEKQVTDFDSARMIPDVAFGKWARYEIESEHGLNEDNNATFFDFDRYAQYQQENYFTRIDLDGEIVWVAPDE